MSLFRTKSIEQSIRDTEEPGHALSRELSALDLIVFGVGVIIGTGIFVLTGTAARNTAGPAVAISFVIAGVVCTFAALCYAEFASTVPVAGSAYTFSYTTLGEFPAWIIGWDLMLELVLASAVVAVGWSGYFRSLLESGGVSLPEVIAGGSESTFNLPAAMIIVLLTVILVVGIKMSARFNAIMVAIKTSIVLLVIVVGLFFVKVDNYRPFIPPAQQSEAVEGLRAPLIQVLFGLTPTVFGVFGILTAAAIVFFAFIGFDIVATAAEETRNPQRDLPIGILGSLVICTVLYVVVSLVVTGMQNYATLDTGAPLSSAFKAVGHGGFATIINVGALAGLTTVSMILLLGQSRVFFAMSRDGLLPPFFSQVHPRFGTPYRSTILIGAVAAVLAAFIPLEALAEMVNIGTLAAFIVVSAAVLILRRTRPDLPRAFRTPFVPLIPILSILACLYLMLNLAVETWLRFVVWMLIGLVLYFTYGRFHSRLGNGGAERRLSSFGPAGDPSRGDIDGM